MTWQMMVALFHANGQLRTDRNGDTEKGCQKHAVQQKTTDNDDVRQVTMSVKLSVILRLILFRDRIGPMTFHKRIISYTVKHKTRKIV